MSEKETWVFVINPIQLVIIWPKKHYGYKQWWKCMSSWIVFRKIQVTEYSWPSVTVILVKGRQRKLIICPQVNLGWSQESFTTPVGFDLTLDMIHRTRKEFIVNSKSYEFLERSPFSLIIEGSILSGLKGTGPQIFAISSKTFELRVLKLEKNPKQSILPKFQ